MFPEGFWIIAVVAAVCCSMGFKKFVWFMSVGYGLAVAGIGVTLGAMAVMRSEWSVPYLCMCALLVVYGFRLGGFLAIREVSNAAYRKTLDSVAGDYKKMPFSVLVIMWIMVSALYYIQTTPVFYRLANHMSVEEKIDVWFYVGMVISAVGIVVEAEADRQKSVQKKINPNMPATTGLYRICRCPNYLGEIIFWSGLTVSSIQSNKGVQWILVALGYVIIVWVMFDGAKRLEKRQNEKYGSNLEYVEYVKKTPRIIPLIRRTTL